MSDVEWRATKLTFLMEAHERLPKTSRDWHHRHQRLQECLEAVQRQLRKGS
jgi:hypothetical protein